MGAPRLKGHGHDHGSVGPGVLLAEMSFSVAEVIDETGTLLLAMITTFPSAADRAEANRSTAISGNRIFFMASFPSD